MNDRTRAADVSLPPMGNMRQASHVSSQNSVHNRRTGERSESLHRTRRGMGESPPAICRATLSLPEDAKE
jgi:hypothetical protein